MQQPRSARKLYEIDTQSPEAESDHESQAPESFAHPVSANIASRAVKPVIQELEGTFEQRHSDRIGVRLNENLAEFHYPKHALRPDEVRRISKFINDAGVDPARDYPL